MSNSVFSNRSASRRAGEDLSANGAPQSADSPEPRAIAARRQLLGEISDFTLKHELEVNSVNLATICSALSGHNGELAEAFATREISGEPIDQRWLNTIVRLDPETNGRLSELEKLMDQLEYSLIRFAATAKSAQHETSDHRGALDAQIVAIEQAPFAQVGHAEVDRVINLSRAMIERIKQVEEAMARSQVETEKLRENLAKARMEADVDHLTRLPNRRVFERRFISASQEARAKGEPLCVAFCDVDRFKQINDKFGHDAGDRILVAIANTLSESASDHCFVARHGGEEFVLLFYGMDKDTACRKLDGVRRAQAAKQLIDRETGRPFGKITFSGGIAEVTEDADARSALARADAALYEAKECGRNRIVAH